MSDFQPTEGETVLASGKGYVITNLRLWLENRKGQYNTNLIWWVGKAKASGWGGGWTVSISATSIGSGSFDVKDEAEADLVMAALARASR